MLYRSSLRSSITIEIDLNLGLQAARTMNNTTPSSDDREEDLVLQALSLTNCSKRPSKLSDILLQLLGEVRRSKVSLLRKSLMHVHCAKLPFSVLVPHFFLFIVHNYKTARCTANRFFITLRKRPTFLNLVKS